MSDLIELPLRAILVGDFMPGNGEVVERMAMGEMVEIVCEDGCSLEDDQDTVLGVEDIAIGKWDIEYFEGLELE